MNSSTNQGSLEPQPYQKSSNHDQQPQQLVKPDQSNQDKSPFQRGGTGKSISASGWINSQIYISHWDNEGLCEEWQSIENMANSTSTQGDFKGNQPYKCSMEDQRKPQQKQKYSLNQTLQRHIQKRSLQGDYLSLQEETSLNNINHTLIQQGQINDDNLQKQHKQLIEQLLSPYFSQKIAETMEICFRKINKKTLYYFKLFHLMKLYNCQVEGPLDFPMYQKISTKNYGAVQFSIKELLGQILITTDEFSFTYLVNNFLLNIYEYIIHPVQLLLYNIHIFLLSPPSNLCKVEQEHYELSRGSHYKNRVARFLDCWIQKRAEDFLQEDNTLYTLLSFFMQYLKKDPNLNKRMNLNFRNFKEKFASLTMLHKKLSRSHLQSTSSLYSSFGSIGLQLSNSIHHPSRDSLFKFSARSSNSPDKSVISNESFNQHTFSQIIDERPGSKQPYMSQISVNSQSDQKPGFKTQNSETPHQNTTPGTSTPNNNSSSCIIPQTSLGSDTQQQRFSVSAFDPLSIIPSHENEYLEDPSESEICNREKRMSDPVAIHQITGQSSNPPRINQERLAAYKAPYKMELQNNLNHESNSLVTHQDPNFKNSLQDVQSHWKKDSKNITSICKFCEANLQYQISQQRDQTPLVRQGLTKQAAKGLALNPNKSYAHNNAIGSQKDILNTTLKTNLNKRTREFQKDESFQCTCVCSIPNNQLQRTGRKNLTHHAQVNQIMVSPKESNSIKEIDENKLQKQKNYSNYLKIQEKTDQPVPFDYSSIQQAPQGSTSKFTEQIQRKAPHPQSHHTLSQRQVNQMTYHTNLLIQFIGLKVRDFAQTILYIDLKHFLKLKQRDLHPKRLVANSNEKGQDYQNYTYRFNTFIDFMTYLVVFQKNPTLRVQMILKLLDVYYYSMTQVLNMNILRQIRIVVNSLSLKAMPHTQKLLKMKLNHQNKLAYNDIKQNIFNLKMPLEQVIDQKMVMCPSIMMLSEYFIKSDSLLGKSLKKQEQENEFGEVNVLHVNMHKLKSVSDQLNLITKIKESKLIKNFMVNFQISEMTAFVEKGYSDWMLDEFKLGQASELNHHSIGDQIYNLAIKKEAF